MLVVFLEKAWGKSDAGAGAKTIVVSGYQYDSRGCEQLNDDEARDAPEALRANTNAVSATENNHIQRKREGATNLMDHRACREARSAPDTLRGMVNRMTGNAAAPEVQPGTNACEPRLPEFKSVQPPVFGVTETALSL